MSFNRGFELHGSFRIQQIERHNLMAGAVVTKRAAMSTIATSRFGKLLAWAG